MTAKDNANQTGRLTCDINIDYIPADIKRRAKGKPVKILNYPFRDKFDLVDETFVENKKFCWFNQRLTKRQKELLSKTAGSGQSVPNVRSVLVVGLGAARKSVSPRGTHSSLGETRLRDDDRPAIGLAAGRRTVL